MEKNVFGYFMPVVNLMGFGAAQDVGEQMSLLGKNKALIVTDKPLMNVGIPEKIKQYIEKSGHQAVIWDHTQPNPTDKNVHDGLEFFKSNNCNIIISVGGGSPHDCAKGIRIVADNGGNIRDYEGVNKSKKSNIPLISVNTTSGTASEITRFCIITDTSRHVKMAIVDWRCTPNVSVNDPELMVAMPKGLTAATGMDALTHAVEAYVSTIATPVTDCAALKAIDLISKWLRAAVKDGNNLEARENMTYAQLLAGMAFNNASLGYVHAMAHQLGGLYDLPHGVCNAVLLPHVCRFNMNEKLQRFADIAVAMGEDVKGLSTEKMALRAIESIQRLAMDVNIPANLKELGVKEEDLETMAKNAMVDACAATNPRKATLQDIVNVYKEALYAEVKALI